MIKFFRKVRQRLITENRFSKYLLYAIGEIILVMVGILLALQVNNWNEKRKESKIELDILTGIKNDLDDDILRLTYRVSNDSLIVARADQLLAILEDDSSIYIDSIMDKLFGSIESFIPFHPKKLAYSTLQQNGLSIISNDSLLEKIILNYDVSYVAQEDAEIAIKEVFFNGLNINYKYLSTSAYVFRKHPNDFEALKKNNEYKNYLSHTAALRRLFMNNTKIIIDYAIEVRDEIENEIIRLQNK